jgi:hypothetical protein
MEKSYLEQLETGDVTIGIEKAERDLERHKILQRNLEVEWDLKSKEFALLDEADNAKIIDAKYKYQTLPAYWDLQKGYRALELERQRIDYEDKMAQLIKVIKAKSDEVERLKGEKK